MFLDKRFAAKDADLKGEILFWLIIVPLPSFLLIHGMYNVCNADIITGTAELTFGCIVAGFWITQFIKSKKNEKVILKIIEEGVCSECSILEYSEEEDQYGTPECVVIQSGEEIYIFGVNHVSVPEHFPIGSINKLFIRKRDEQVDMLVTKYEVNELANTIDNKLSVLPKIYKKYAKKYGVGNGN